MSDKPKLATKQELMARRGQRRYQELTLPASGLAVRIRSLTEREYAEHEASMLGPDYRVDAQKLLAATRRLIAMCLCDDQGNRFLDDADVELIADWDSKDTETLYEECLRLTGKLKPQVTAKN